MKPLFLLFTLHASLFTLLFILLFTVASCSSSRQVTSRATVQRTDTLRALLAEQLSVCLDDVVIIPPDTVSPRIVARRATLRRQSAATVARVSGLNTETRTDETAKKETPSLRAPLFSILFIFAVIALFTWLLSSPPGRR